MTPDEYRQHDALGLAALVRRGEVKPEELLATALALGEAANQRFNPINRWMTTAAQAQLGQGLRGAFAGVPFLVKDVVQDVAGEPTSAGSQAFADTPAMADSTYVTRARAAGLVIFGKTNLPELALKGVTENRVFGATRNPWDPARTPGGSSGGAAAAIAAGVVPMAGANDGGGSIRIPAAYCGLFGLRPGRGRIPVGPAAGEVWEGASSDHVLTRSVRDSAAMLDVLAGPDSGAPFHVAPHTRPYLEEVGREPGRLRIAVSSRSPVDGPVDAECRRAVEETARLLETLGHHVEEAEPAVDGLELARCYIRLYFGQVAAATQGHPAAAFELDTRALAMLGRALTSGEYVEARQQWNQFARALGAFFERFDLYLTPTVAAPPARIGELDTPALERVALRPLLWLNAGRLLLRSGLLDKLAFRSLVRTPFTQLANLTGTPAMSVPLYRTPEGLPLGSQFIAPVGEEGRLIRLAAQLEQARPWFDHLPEWA
ncbi:MAG: amidase [Ectothiorhodospiraceae bacterium]|nr:amidase [Ectothiorhodospiraceae bacterium]